MAVKVLTLEEQKKLAGVMYTLPGTVYLNQNRDKIVEEGSPEQYWQLGTKGTQIPMSQAIQLGLVESYTVEVITTGAAAKAVSKPDENKAMSGPEENKAVATPASTKTKKETKPENE